MSGPSRAVAAQRRAVAAHLADLPAGALVLVACSGGADSLALAAATAHVVRLSARKALRPGGPVRPLRAGAVVVDHGLRPDSARVADEAARVCATLGLDPVRVVPALWEDAAGGGEGAAREARLAALTRTAERDGAHAVLLGHTLDDQAETVLLALARGSGPTALAGMPPRRGLLRRPFLEVRRSETRSACADLGLRPDEDPTNAPDGPWRAADGSPLRRAAVRSSALPVLSADLGTDVAPALARTARRVREDEELLGAWAADLLARATLSTPHGAAPGPAEVRLDVRTLAGAPGPLRDRALHAALLAAGAPPGQVSHRHVGSLAALVERRGRGPVHLPGVVARREAGGGRGGGAADALVCYRPSVADEGKHDGRQGPG